MTIERKARTITVQLEPDQFEMLKAASAEHGMTIPQAVTDAIDDWVAREWARMNSFVLSHVSSA